MGYVFVVAVGDDHSDVPLLGCCGMRVSSSGACYDAVVTGGCAVQAENGTMFVTGLILGLCPANERRRYFVTTSLIGWAQAWY